MKKDRNCNEGMTPYPIYQPNIMFPNQGAMLQPNIMMPMNMPYNYNISNYQTGGNGTTIEQQLNNLNAQISSLERRVSNLENLIGNSSNQYNTSNYQVM